MVWFTGNNYDYASAARARRAEDDAMENAYEWQAYANDLESTIQRLRSNLKKAVAERDGYRAELIHVGEVQALSSQGITLPAYTNNLAHEMYILRDELLNMPAPGPFAWGKEKQKRLAALSVAERREINMRLLCRAEWFDWCNHADVIAKFNTALLGAQMNPTEANKHLRQKDMLTYYHKACEDYFRIRDQAMEPALGEKVRAAFERERYAFWKNQLRFSLNGAIEATYPSFTETVKIIPSLRPDTYLVGGKVVEKFGLHIGTLKPAKYYRDCLASYEVCSGVNDRVGGNYYV